MRQASCWRLELGTEQTYFESCRDYVSIGETESKQIAKLITDQKKTVKEMKRHVVGNGLEIAVGGQSCLGSF